MQNLEIFKNAVIASQTPEEIIKLINSLHENACKCNLGLCNVRCEWCYIEYLMNEAPDNEQNC